VYIIQVHGLERDKAKVLERDVYTLLRQHYYVLAGGIVSLPIVGP
jgi:hypothetical protein